MAVLPDGGAERPGERPGLQVRDPHLAVFDPPRRLVGVDAQLHHPPFQLVVRGRAIRSRPMRQVVRHPQIRIKVRGREVLVELESVAGAIKQVAPVAIVRIHGRWHALHTSTCEGRRHKPEVPKPRASVPFSQAPD